MLPNTQPQISMENSLTSARKDGVSPKLREIKKQTENRMAAHNSPRKNPFCPEHLAQKKAAAAARTQPSSRPIPFVAQIGTRPADIASASIPISTTPSAVADRHPTAVARIWRFLLWRDFCAGLPRAVMVFFSIKNHPVFCQ